MQSLVTILCLAGLVLNSLVALPSAYASAACRATAAHADETVAAASGDTCCPPIGKGGVEALDGEDDEARIPSPGDCRQCTYCKILPAGSMLKVEPPVRLTQPTGRTPPPPPIAFLSVGFPLPAVPPPLA